MKKKNMVNELLRERRKAISEEQLMEEVRAILAADEKEREAIRERLSEEKKEHPGGNAFIFELLEADRIFNVSQIKNVCIDYRLRFLDSHYFLDSIPEEAVSQIKSLENVHNTIVSGFRIVAPSKRFRLKNYDDPMLFAPMGNDYYYLIHKWGDDLSPYRKLWVRPVRDFGSLLLTLVIASLLFTLAVTALFFTGTQIDKFILVTFLFTFKAFCGIALYYCFWKGKSVNSAIWDSEFSNR